MSQIFFSRHDGGLTLYKDGKPQTVASDHPNFAKILNALREKKYEVLDALMSISATITSLGSKVSKKFEGRKVFVRNGKVYWIDSHKKEQEMHGTLVDRILDVLDKPSGEKYADALLALMDNIKRNPLKDIRNELYEFLMSGKTPITMDGCFLAYKKVRKPNEKGEYLDIYTGTMDNAPGKIPRMKQKDVDTNRDVTCSRGLHFCSRGYLGSYGGWHNDTVVIVKVNPMHVFAIPTDYQFQKGRASEYYVVGEVKPGWNGNTDVFESSFIDEDTKLTDAPNVVFKAPLKASLATRAESYGLIEDGKARVIATGGSWIPVREEDGEYFDIIGTPVDGEVRYMSVETKSVRAALKEALEKAEGSME